MVTDFFFFLLFLAFTAAMILFIADMLLFPSYRDLQLFYKPFFSIYVFLLVLFLCFVFFRFEFESRGLAGRAVRCKSWTVIGLAPS